MNIVQLTEHLKSMPKEQIIAYAQGQGSGEVPQYLAVSELSRRKGEEQRLAAMQNPQKPQTTVAEDVVAAAGVPQQGIGQIARAMAPKTDMVNNTGQQPTQMMASGGRVSSSGMYYDEYGLPRFRVPPRRPEYGPSVDRSAPTMRSVDVESGDARRSNAKLGKALESIRGNFGGGENPSRTVRPGDLQPQLRDSVDELPLRFTDPETPEVSPDIQDYMVGGEGFYNVPSEYAEELPFTAQPPALPALPPSKVSSERAIDRDMAALPPDGYFNYSVGPDARRGKRAPDNTGTAIVPPMAFDDSVAGTLARGAAPGDRALYDLMYSGRGMSASPPVGGAEAGPGMWDWLKERHKEVWKPIEDEQARLVTKGDPNALDGANLLPDADVLSQPAPDDPKKPDPDAVRAVSGSTGSSISASLAQLGDPGNDEIDRQFAQDKWMALARTGFAMMASDNPTLLGALGEGAMYGMEAFDAALDRRTAAEDRAYDRAMEEAKFNLAVQSARARAAGRGSSGSKLDVKDLIDRERNLLTNLEQYSGIDPEMLSDREKIRIGQMQEEVNRLSSYIGQLTGMSSGGPDASAPVAMPSAGR